jgi:hypothetical protein
MTITQIIPILCLATLTALPSGQKDSASSHADTKGSCSPIAPNNQGSITITCKGFSDEQVKVITRFLHQLSSDQVKDQNQLLHKLDEILKAVQENQVRNNPRVIPDETIRQISYSPWATCSPENVRIIAPHDDQEASQLALQIQSIFRNNGMQARVEYRSLPPNTTNPVDLRIFTTVFNSCGVQFFTVNVFHQFKISMEDYRSPKNVSPEEVKKQAANPKLPVEIYIYPKLSPSTPQ